jgi:serine/threonine protein kinase
MSVLRGSDLVGRVIGGRYRLLRPVGSGGSAHVYVAEDVRLKRRVALKVLHPALAQDRSFQRRFQAEAQIVAGLRHPGIVRVYDWGEDGDEAYLAMELLEGGSLRGLLDSGYRFSISQVAALGLDVAAALAYAHSRGLVHRDIKPANLLFDEEGHASVADFGIARALAEASWTEPVGALVGTARYAAPEQLRGVALDGKADVYSLALVLVEAATGEVPFARDTTLGSLIARASTDVPVPSELGLLAPAIEQAGLASPVSRLSAEALAHEIASATPHLRAPAPLPLYRLPPDSVGLREPTELGSGLRPSVDPGLSILIDDLPVIIEDAPAEPSPEPEQAPFSPAPVPNREVPSDAHVSKAHVSNGHAVDDEEGRRPTDRRRGPRRLLLVVVVLVLAGAGVAAGVYLTRPAPPPPPPPPTYAVPHLTGDKLVTAEALLAREHLLATVTARDWSSTAPAGTVTSQYPLSGARLLAHKVVSLTVSRGPEPVAVPSLATLDLAQARSFLAATGLRLGQVARRTSMTVPTGIVISWTSKGRKLPPGSAVAVVISAGKPMATIPASADGMTYTQLDADLVALGFIVTEDRYYSTTVSAGVVISTDPVPGTTHVVGTGVTVNVSLGPHLVTIPTSVVGLSAVQAAKDLEALGLYVYRVAGSPLGTVQSTEPAAGTAVLYGSSVVLVTSG